MRLIFATNNLHKLSEIKSILGDKYASFVFSTKDLMLNVDPEESGNSFAENSKIKANALYDTMKSNDLIKVGDYIIADDTGLCIDYLDGAPGIYSARYMGENVSQEEKNLKILDIMKDVPNDKRTAYFVTNLAVIEVKDKWKKETPLIFEGRINGYIVKIIEKTGGFGYDPIFAVGSTDDLAKNTVNTYSSMGIANKNKISHRARAIAAFVQYLEK